MAKKRRTIGLNTKPREKCFYLFCCVVSQHCQSKLPLFHILSIDAAQR